MPTVQGADVPGTGAEVADKLGRLRKGIFTGQCAGHPQAAAFVTGADKMIAEEQKTQTPRAAKP